MKSVPDTRESLLIRLSNPADEAAWREFLEIYRPVIYRLACRVGRRDISGPLTGQHACRYTLGLSPRRRQQWP